MKAVIQRVLSAFVEVDNVEISRIDKGIMVLVGIGTDDTMADVNALASKVLNLRLFSGESGSGSVTPASNPSDSTSGPASSNGTDANQLATHVNDLAANETGTARQARPWRRSVMDIQGEVLCVSQFTLHAVTKGTSLDFHRAMGAESSRDMYASFLDKMGEIYKGHGDRIKDGKFGAMMNVSLTNEGPVTIILDTKAKK